MERILIAPSVPPLWSAAEFLLREHAIIVVLLGGVGAVAVWGTLLEGDGVVTAWFGADDGQFDGIVVVGVGHVVDLRLFSGSRGRGWITAREE